VLVVDACLRCEASGATAVKIIDARSGEVMRPGKTVSYGGGEKLRVVVVDEQGLFRAQALVETTYRDYSRTDQKPTLVTKTQWVPLSVRFMHPAYPFERVAFIPS
jgi:hypothetical protein